MLEAPMLFFLMLWGGLGGPFGGSWRLGQSWVPSRGLVASILGAPCASWGLSCALLGAKMALLGPFWGHLEAIFGHLEATWDPLEPMLGPLRGFLGAWLALLGPSWCLLLLKTKNHHFPPVFNTF